MGSSEKIIVFFPHKKGVLYVCDPSFWTDKALCFYSEEDRVLRYINYTALDYDQDSIVPVQFAAMADYNSKLARLSAHIMKALKTYEWSTDTSISVYGE